MPSSEQSHDHLLTVALDLSATTLSADRVLLGSSHLDLLLVDVVELGLVLVPVLLGTNGIIVSGDVVRSHRAPNTVERLVLDGDPKQSLTVMLTSSGSSL